MRVILLTPGTGSYHCGVCMRDNALAKELIRQGHDAVMLPMYLPLTLDESRANPDTPIFYGGISVYLQQKFALFRHTPRWLDRLINHPALLRLAGRQSGMTDSGDLGELTVSMLRGEEGRQAKELAELIAWLKEHGKPDAVWLSTALIAGLARQIKAELGIPVLGSLQGEDSFLDSLPAPWRERSWTTLAERARDVDLWIAPSRFYAELMQPRMQVPPEKLRVIPNGISLDGFESKRGRPRPHEAQPADEAVRTPAIGFLARLFADKGLGLVVDAFIELKKRGRFPQAKLRCAGSMTAEDESYVAEMKSRLEAAGFGGDAEFLPNVSRDEKIAFLRSLTLLTVPPRYSEAFGLYVIEALAAGVPVVQPRAAAFPEIVETTGGGILFEPNTPSALADAWESLLADQAKARELGRRGLEAVTREFSIERMAQRFLEATREIQAQALAGARATG